MKNTYLITIKDLSAITSQSIFEATLNVSNTELIQAISNLIQEYAENLDTTADMIDVIRVENIINPEDVPY